MARKIDPSKMGRKGGKARAVALSQEERTEIARKAANARWAQGADEDMPKAICGGKKPLKIGEIAIPCYVLDDETRVLSQRGLQQAIGMAEGGGAKRMTAFVEGLGDKSSRINELAVRINAPILFQPTGGGKPAHGYEATMLADLCQVVLEARREGRLNPQQNDIANTCEVLLGGFAHIGIIALVDQATGYDRIAKRLDYAAILDKYLDDKLNQWTKTFQDEFYEQFFRLKGWDFSRLKAGDYKPVEVAVFTRDQVYRRLHPGIVEELERSNPFVVPGRRLNKHHQWLTREIGHPALKNHVDSIVVVMRLSKNWLDFESKLQTALPMPQSDTPFFGFIAEENG